MGGGKDKVSGRNVEGSEFGTKMDFQMLKELTTCILHTFSFHLKWLDKLRIKLLIVREEVRRLYLTLAAF